MRSGFYISCRAVCSLVNGLAKWSLLSFKKEKYAIKFLLLRFDHLNYFQCSFIYFGFFLTQFIQKKRQTNLNGAKKMVFLYLASLEKNLFNSFDVHVHVYTLSFHSYSLFSFCGSSVMRNYLHLSFIMTLSKLNTSRPFNSASF